MKKKIDSIKPIFSFLAVCFLLFIFTFYMDGEMGIILVFFTFSAPIVSIIFTALGRAKVQVSLESEAYVKKGNEIEIKINAVKHTHCPIGFVEIHTECGEVFTQSVNAYRTALNFKQSITINHKLFAKYGGNGRFAVKEVYICDFLGFFKLKTKNTLPKTLSIGVIPDIPEISASVQLYRLISDVVITSDDEEEQDSVLAFSANTNPGYEHREYIEGDSLKRINWKVSSKRNKLMVRLDEAVSSVQPAIVFDLYRPKSENILGSVIREEKLYESVFGLLMLFIKQGIGCRFFFRSADGSVAERTVESEDMANQVLFGILSVPINDDSGIEMQNLDIGGACALILAVPCLTEAYAANINLLKNMENCNIIISDTINTVKDFSSSIWYLDDDNNYKLVK